MQSLSTVPYWLIILSCLICGKSLGFWFSVRLCNRYFSQNNSRWANFMICFVRAAWSEAVNGVLLLHSITVSNGFDQKNSTSIACFYYFGGLTGLAWYHGNHRISGNHKAYPNSFIFKTHHLFLFALVNELFWQLYFLVFASLSPSSERLVCVGKCIFMNALKPRPTVGKNISELWHQEFL